MTVQDLSQNSNEPRALPKELSNEDNVALKWTIFALFAAISPFVVLLMPKVAGPIILFGALVFGAIFLLSDQISDMHKNAVALWKNEHSTRIVSLRVDAPEEEGPEFFFHLEEKLQQLASQNYTVCLVSEGAKDELRESTVGKNRAFIEAAKVTYSKDLPDLILVTINKHRYWCRPWHYQHDYNDEIESFKVHKDN